MSEVTISNSPVHSQAIITYPYGVADSSYSCGFHTGVDFAPYGSTPSNPILYSVVAGEVVYVNNTDDVALRSTSSNISIRRNILALLSYGIK